VDGEPVSDFLRSLTPTRTVVIDGLFSLLLVAIALVGFRTSFGGVEFLFVGAMAAALGVLLAHIIQARYVGPIPALAIALVMFVVLAGPIALRQDAIAGFIPTLGTFNALVDGVVRGWVRLLTTVAPTGGIDHLLAIPYVAGFFAGLATMLVARRSKRLLPVVVPSAVVSAVAILFGTKVPASLIIQGGLYIAGALLWLSIRRERERGEIISTSPGRTRWIGVAMMLALAVAGATLFGPRLPLAQARERVVLREQTEPPFDPRDYPSPLSGFRKVRVDLAEKVLLTIDHVPEGSPRLRLAVMDDYDGVVWNVSGGGRSGAGYFERVGATIDQPLAEEIFESSITVRSLDGVWAPTFGTTTGLSFVGDRAEDLGESFRYNATSGVAALPIGIRDGDSFEVSTGLLPQRDDEELQLAAVDKTIIYEEIVGLPAEFEATAADIVAGASNPYDQARALENYFQQGAYSDGGPDEIVQVPPGHSIGHILRFIGEDQLVGDGEQYAAAMALMARSLGLPARVVVGFDLEPGEEQVEILGEDVEAWVEVALAEVGWVPFYPTPDEANAPSESNQEQLRKNQIETQVPPPISNPPTVPDPLIENLNELDEEEGEEDELLPPPDEAGIAGLGWLGTAIAAVVGIPLIVGGSYLAVALLLKHRRRSRRRSFGSPAQRIARGWREILDHALDQQRDLPMRATRTEAALVLGGSLPTLASVADSRVFGSHEPSDGDANSFWMGVDHALSEMTQSQGMFDRVKTVASLRSLRRAVGRK
jgi:transglutaminase-like putative cysteine protease